MPPIPFDFGTRWWELSEEIMAVHLGSGLAIPHAGDLAQKVRAQVLPSHSAASTRARVSSMRAV
jgi:hypothetical protein